MPELVLLVEDEPDTAALERRWLERAGYAVEVFRDAEACLGALARTVPSLLLLDLELPGMGGLEALERVVDRSPRLPVIITTANREVDVVVEAMRRGAYDYVAKPLDATRLVTSVQNAIETSRMSRRVRELERIASGEAGFAGLIGRSAPMQRLFGELDRAASNDIAVLVHGESGTGKELVARALHEQSGRAAGPFVAVNCAAIPESLMESEFFGHEKGAFTGAQRTHAGYFEAADGGTLFLDEIAELALPLQAKLLRALQERRIVRVGGTAPIPVDFRLVAATHRDLRTEVSAGRFREDLFYRVAVFEMDVPPLRDRAGDLPLLAEHLLRRLSPERPVRLSDEALEVLSDLPFPGNVRELENALHRALVVCRDEVIEVGDLPKRMTSRPPDALSVVVTSAPGGRTMEDIERLAIQRALEKHEGNVAAVVRELGLGRTTVYRKLKKYGFK